MTLIHFDVKQFTTNNIIGAKITMAWRPARKIIDDTTLTLPTAFTLEIDGTRDVEITPNTTQWCWEVYENITDTTPRYLTIPDTTKTNYTQLTPIDPATLTPYLSQGPTGPQGDPGPQGNTGPQGPRGYTGNPGKDGTNGTNGTNGIADDASVAAAIPQPLTQAALNAAYAPITAGRIGPRWLFLGDSITAGSVTSDQVYWSGAFAVQASLISKGQIIMVRDAGIPGNTTAQMDTRFVTDVTPYAAQIDVVFLLAGTNDSLTPLSSYIASMKSIIGKIRAIGKQPIMATIPPNNGAAPRPATITQQNAWIRRYAGINGIPLVDFYKVLVNQGTGAYLTGYSDDGTHPNANGRAPMATALVNTLQSLLSPSPVIIPQDSNDPNNLLTNGCFTSWTTPVTPPTITIGTVASGGTLAAGTYYYKVTVLNFQGESLPSNEVSVTITSGQQPQLNIPTVTGQRVLNIYRSTTSGNEVLLAANVTPGTPTTWLDSGSLTPGTTPVPTIDYTTSPIGWGGSTAGPAQLSKLTDTAFQGFAARFNATGTQRGQKQTIAMSGKYAIGDTLALVGVVRSGLQAPNLLYRFNGGTAPAACTLIADAATAWGPGVYYKEFNVPTGTTSLDVYFQNDASATGSCDFGQIGVYNLTALGIL